MATLDQRPTFAEGDIFHVVVYPLYSSNICSSTAIIYSLETAD